MANVASVGLMAAVSVAAVIFAEVEALACNPAPGVTYDDELKDPTALVVTADVTKFEIAFKGNTACWRTHYAIREVLLGAHEGPLEVSVCFPGSPELGKQTDEALEYFGFVEGAFVIAAMTKASPVNTSPRMAAEHTGEFRYLHPMCWGILHLNLGNASEQERNDFLEQYRANVRKSRHGD